MTSAEPASEPAWSLRLVSELRAADRRVRELAHGLSSEQLNWRPRPDAWSIGQCLQHLLMGTECYLPAIAASLEGRQRRRVAEITPGWFGRWFIRNYIAPASRNTKGRAPGKIRPAEHVDPAVLELFLRSNESARHMVRTASDFDVNRIRFRNPFVPLIRFTVGTGLEIVSKHQARHLLQAERVKQSEGFPSSRAQ